MLGVHTDPENLKYPGSYVVCATINGFASELQSLTIWCNDSYAINVNR